MPRDINDVDSGLIFEHEESCKQLAASPMQKVFVPVFLHELRNDYSNLSVWVFALEHMNVIDSSMNYRPIRRAKDLQRRHWQACFACRAFHQRAPPFF